MRDRNPWNGNHNGRECGRPEKCGKLKLRRKCEGGNQALFNHRNQWSDEKMAIEARVDATRGNHRRDLRRHSEKRFIELFSVRGGASTCQACGMDAYGGWNSPTALRLEACKYIRLITQVTQACVCQYADIRRQLTNAIQRPSPGVRESDCTLILPYCGGEWQHMKGTLCIVVAPLALVGSKIWRVVGRWKASNAVNGVVKLLNKLVNYAFSFSW